MRSGQLRDSIYDETSGSTISIKATAPQARYVTQGVRPHEIVAVNARALRWVDSEGAHFAARVLHPGSAANPFGERIGAAMISEIGAALRQAVRNAVRTEAA